EGGVDVDVSLGRCLQESNGMVGSDLLSSLPAHSPSIRHVALVAYQHLHYVLGGVLIDVPQPSGDVLEALDVRDIVNQHDPVRFPQLGGGDGMESLLASSVP
ncbi:hypothetical protein PMAYCL1PPCAC_22972, partial [Pristionchus mayeri]